ncbi:MAG: hypothetical protein JW940_24415 [Polyangiaceae bacterium]|nr:hypothetical protein [Polyangiaceae bacterium]
MKPVRVFLGGEGRNELGSRSGDPIYQSNEQPGVIQALLGRVQQQGWVPIGGCRWREIRKYQAKGPTPAEERNVLGLVEKAEREGAEVVAFVRDSDGDKDRPAIIRAAVEKASELFPQTDVIGAAAIPVLEGWILAMLGQHVTEKLGKAGAQSKLELAGIPRKDTAAMVDVVAKAVPEQPPGDASSLKAWLGTAAEVLQRRVAAPSAAPTMAE